MPTPREEIEALLGRRMADEELESVSDLNAFPAHYIAEAARILRPNGILVLVDFAPHTLEFLREEHAHRRLGFTDSEVAEWCSAAGLQGLRPRRLPGDPLTVVIWTARRDPAIADFVINAPALAAPAPCA